MNRSILFVCVCLIAVLPACSPHIYGTVQLVDAGLQPIPVAKESPEGTVVNMINTTTSLEKASHSAHSRQGREIRIRKGRHCARPL